jgi:hypothetical protein
MSEENLPDQGPGFSITVERTSIVDHPWCATIYGRRPTPQYCYGPTPQIALHKALLQIVERP